MAFNSNGQISYLVLDSLSSGSKYGLEIIEFISQKTNGSYIMKKPTLYSCLTRMEKKGLVSSSYWGESEFGGKRHYYSITSQGRATLEELAKDFENATYEPQTTSTQIENTPAEPVIQPKPQTAVEDKPVFLQQDNIFDIVKKENKPESPAKKSEPVAQDIIENQIDIFSFQASQEAEKLVEPEIIENSQPEQVSVHDDAKLLDENETLVLSQSQTEQNQRIYDTSSELKRYRKKKSFSENQIEMAVVYESAEDAEIQRSRIEQLKKSMLAAKNNNFEEIEKPAIEPVSEQKPTFTQTIQPEIVHKDEVEEEKHDDAVFITNPMLDERNIPIQKKILPTNIEVNIDDDDLPAPKRDTNLEPTYKDMMAKLFERKKEKQKVAPTPEPIQPVEETSSNQNIDTFADYNNLKKYYNNHGIEFKEYKKTNVDRRHNTNFLHFISSAVMFTLSGIGCALIFWLVSALGLTKTSTNFMFYTLPIIFCAYTLFRYIVHKAVPSKKASIVYNGLINWTVFILGSLVVFVINITCGMQFETIPEYLTSLLIPILGIFLAFPVNYYAKKYLYRKFAK